MIEAAVTCYALDVRAVAHSAEIVEPGCGMRPRSLDHVQPTRGADVWCALPKIVFSRTLGSVQGNARLADKSVAEGVAAARDATVKDVSIGGAGLAAVAKGGMMPPAAVPWATTPSAYGTAAISAPPRDERSEPRSRDQRAARSPCCS